MKTQDAIRHFGSAKALAEALGITVFAVYQWRDMVPRGREYELHLKSGGKLPLNGSRKQGKRVA